MCGFVGYYSLDSSCTLPDKQHIDSLLSRIYHRGPDSSGFYSDNKVALGFRRLAIIDITENANQPFNDCNVTLVFNGEIYNYLELRTELINLGFQFKTKSDTEVVVKLYQYFGISFVSKLNGMFAIALYDSDKDCLFLIRDRVGKKPLYYSIIDGKLFFGSELKLFLANEFISNKLENKALIQYLNLGYTISPITIVKNVFKVEPGSYIKFSLGRTESQIEKYWEFNNYTNKDLYNKELKYISNELKSLLFKSIEIRLHSDVPIGILLSGGIDSGIIAAISSKISKKIDAFTIDFNDKNLSEIKLAKEIVKRYSNISHHTLMLNPDLFLNNFSIIENMDEPISDSSIIPMYFVSKFISENNIVVALSGDGGDELQMGYYKNNNFNAANFWYNYISKFISNPILNIIKSYFNNANLIEKLLISKDYIYFYNKSIFKNIQLRKIINAKFNFYDSEYFPQITGVDYNQVIEYGDFKYKLVEDYLIKTDRASMLNSIEIRNPFLDYNIVEFLASLPKKFKINNNNTKILLKYLAKEYLPSSVLGGVKKGFSIPLKTWVQNDLKSEIFNNIINNSYDEFISQKGLNDLYDLSARSSGQHDQYTELIWRLYIITKFINKWKLS